MVNTAQFPIEAMLQAMTELWRLCPRGSDDLQAAPAFVRLCNVCRDGYPNVGESNLNFSLSTALRALGLPCEIQAGVVHPVSPVENAVARLDAALRATHVKHLHLAPLDLAEGIPSHTFGPAQVGRFKPDKLRKLIDETRLKRTLQGANFDADRFSEFHWLVVEENVVLDGRVNKRIPSVFPLDLSQDFGRIEPHKGRFPSLVEDALFFFLLAPWETWSTMPEVDWRGFQIPWVYTANFNIFLPPKAPPSPNTLTWDVRIDDDGHGGTYEQDRPLELPLRDEAKTELLVWDQRRWTIVEEAKATVLFETPIVHFYVRAFLADGIDEFLAHITAIEAALGLQADYQKDARITPDRHKRKGATAKMRERIVGLLNDRRYAEDYDKLFHLRSAFLHGRKMPAISTEERVLARSLARRVVEALILETQNGQITSREDFLDGLLDRGASIGGAI